MKTLHKIHFSCSVHLKRQGRTVLKKTNNIFDESLYALHCRQVEINGETRPWVSFLLFPISCTEVSRKLALMVYLNCYDVNINFTLDCFLSLYSKYGYRYYVYIRKLDTLPIQAYLNSRLPRGAKLTCL